MIIDINDLINGKYSLPEMWNFRVDDEVFRNCIERQTIDLVPKDAECIFSSDSLTEFIKEEQKRIIYLSEAEIKTYPTDYLSKRLMKSFHEKFHRDVFLSHPLANSSKLFCITSKTNGKVETTNGRIEDHIGSNQIVIVTKYDYVEKDSNNCLIAGRVRYQILWDFDRTMVKGFMEDAYTYGYNFVSMYRLAENDSIVLEFESKFQEDHIGEIGQSLYHVCPSRIKDKILKTGLQPRSKSEMDGRKLDHDARIYLFTKNPSDQLVRRFMLKSNKQRTDNKITVLKVDMKSVPQIKLYRDNMTKSVDPKNPIAVYTLSNIPPKAIMVDREISV